MATVERRKDSSRIIFYYRHQRYSTAIKAADSKDADEIAGSVERTIRLIQKGAIIVPADADFTVFVLSGAKQAERPATPKPRFSLSEIRDRCFGVHEMGSLEANSLYTIKIHLGHIVKSLKASFPIQELSQSHLQQHIQRRAKAKGLYDRPIKTATLRKEIARFRAIWNWAVAAGLVTGPFPNKGLVFPKDREKPPFLTTAEIERQIERGGLSEVEIRELWDNLFLTAAFARERNAQVVVDPCVARVGFDGLAETDDRLVQLTPQPVVGVGVLRVEFDGLPVTGDGLVQLAALRKSTTNKFTVSSSGG